MIIRAATREDLALAGGAVPHRLRCLALERDGATIGLVGLVHAGDGTVWGSAVFTAAARKAPIALHKAGLAVLADARARGIGRIYAYAEEHQPRAVPWLERLGFRAIDPDGRLWVWEAAPHVE